MLFLVTMGCNLKCRDNKFVIEFDERHPLYYHEIAGKWTLMYPQNYGYEFAFLDDYDAEITLYLNTAIIKFKGKFLLEDSRRIRIMISEMMQKDEITDYADYTKEKNFVSVRDSYFLFDGRIIKDSKPEILVLNPIRIIAQGRNSEGYFEPQIRLKKQ